MSDAVFVESLVTELNKAVGGGKTALAEVNALRPRVAALEGARPNATVVQTWRSGASWYRKWSDGFIEQGGTVSCGNSSGSDVYVNFHLSFSGTNFQFFRSSHDPNNGNSSTNHLDSGFKVKSARNVMFRAHGSRTPTADWFACGY